MKRILSIVLMIGILMFSSSAWTDTAYATEVSQYQELTVGSKGEAVLQLQTRLKELGYLNSAADGDFGSRTRGAVYSFQRRHDLKASGIATNETQSLLYSEEARAVPDKNMSIPFTNVKKVYDYYGSRIDCTKKNNLDEAIDEISMHYITFSPDGTVTTNQDIQDDDNLLTHRWTDTDRLKSKQTRTVSVKFDYYGLASVVAVGIREYHTVSGKTVTYEPDQITFYCSDGSIIYPQDESEPAWSTDDGKTSRTTTEYSEEVHNFKWGVSDSIRVTWWVSEAYDLPEGMYVKEVTPGSIVEKAGIQAGDVIVNIGDMFVYENDEILLAAKATILMGESVSVEYYRDGRMHTTTFKLPEEGDKASPETGNSTSFVDELAKLAELLEKGHLTQEEFDAAKAKLLN